MELLLIFFFFAAENRLERNPWMPWANIMTYCYFYRWKHLHHWHISPQTCLLILFDIETSCLWIYIIKVSWEHQWHETSFQWRIGDILQSLVKMNGMSHYWEYCSIKIQNLFNYLNCTWFSVPKHHRFRKNIKNLFLFLWDSGFLFALLF